jgi:hypothetical protein
LLKQLQPYFSAQNLSVAPPGGYKSPGGLNFGGQDNLLTGKKESRGQPNSTRANRKPVLREQEEGINRILNNINVQTRKAGDNGSNLPPIK